MTVPFSPHPSVLTATGPATLSGSVHVEERSAIVITVAGEWADRFAAEAASLLASGDGNASAQARAGEIRRAWVSREVIARAQGMVMQHDHVTDTAAYLSLRDLTRQIGRPRQSLCAELVGSHGE